MCPNHSNRSNREKKNTTAKILFFGAIQTPNIHNASDAWVNISRPMSTINSNAVQCVLCAYFVLCRKRPASHAITNVGGVARTDLELSVLTDAVFFCWSTFTTIINTQSELHSTHTQQQKCFGLIGGKAPRTIYTKHKQNCIVSHRNSSMSARISETMGIFFSIRSVGLTRFG